VGWGGNPRQAVLSRPYVVRVEAVCSGQTVDTLFLERGNFFVKEEAQEKVTKSL
jgi:hypothetical protein